MEKNEKQVEGDKKIPFWKEKTFIASALPLTASVIAIFFDYTYLHYYDIPAIYAEINFFIASYISLMLVLGLALILYVIYIASYLSNKGNIVFKLFMQPWLLSLCIFLWALATFTGQSTTLIYSIYLIIIVGQIFNAYLDSSKNKKFRESLNELIDSAFQSNKSNVQEQKKSFSLIDPIAYVFGFFILYILVVATSNYIVKGLNVWVLKSNPSIIAIKRNNDTYILKAFNAQTLELDAGFKIISISNESLELIPLKIDGDLLSKSNAEYKRKNKESELENQEKTRKSLKEMNAKLSKLISKISSYINNN